MILSRFVVLSVSLIQKVSPFQGIVYGGGRHASDMVVAPLVAVLHKASDTGFSLVMDPADAGLAWYAPSEETPCADDSPMKTNQSRFKRRARGTRHLVCSWHAQWLC